MVTTPELTEDMITEGMARAEQVACDPFMARCFAFPDPIDEARNSCTPKGRYRIGWIVAEGGRTSYDIWLDVHTGEGRLRHRSD